MMVSYFSANSIVGGHFMKKRKITILIAAVLILVAAFAWYQSTKVYGNDKESVIKVIKSVEGYEDKDIHVVKINDFDDVRIVGFLANHNPSYIEFAKNDKGNYVWKHIESNQNEALAMFLSGRAIEKIMFVANDENDVAKMTVDINGETLEQTFPPHEPSVNWVDLPESKEDGYEYRNYKYYDENGDLIEEYE
jgi:LPS O-antigen subunit length determinant protein (WzzB/FepE family)